MEKRKKETIEAVSARKYVFVPLALIEEQLVERGGQKK